MDRNHRRTGVTLKDVVNHISDFKYEINTKIDGLSQRMDRMEGRMGHVEGRMERMEKHIVHMSNALDTLDIKVTNIDARLDVIEASIVEQKHEKRIRRLERLVA